MGVPNSRHVHDRGKVSFDDWDMLTWPLGCTGRFEASGAPASWQQRLEMTSLTFMLNCVPLPVVETCSGETRKSNGDRGVKRLRALFELRVFSGSGFVPRLERDSGFSIEISASRQILRYAPMT